MPNGFNAGDLNLSISTIADDTLKKLDILAERLSFIEGSLKHISGASRNIGKYSGSGKKQSSGFDKSLLNLGKWTAVIVAARRLGRYVGDIVQAGSDYTETLNLWQVAMRNNLDIADQFINKMNKAYGISSENLMNAQATFKNMIGSLGQISDQTAYALSEALVQMSADYASLYNRTLDSAIQNMQSMLAGQVRPIRSAGLDITETTLFQYYQQLGGTKTMRQLNRTEKQLLSILAVYKQMGSAGALGDMTKTLNSFANQSRMMTEYWAELKTWSGLLLKDLIEDWEILKYVNAGLITIKEIVKSIAKSRGLGEENFIDEIYESADATNDEIDELQGKLLDFDKFRSLEGADTSPFAIDEKLLEALTGYSSRISDAKNEALELANTWLASLGYIYDVDKGIWIAGENAFNITEAFELFKEMLPSIISLAKDLNDLLIEIAESDFEVLIPTLQPIIRSLILILDLFNNVLNTLDPLLRLLTEGKDGFVAIANVFEFFVKLVTLYFNTMLNIAAPFYNTIALIAKIIINVVDTILSFFQALVTGDFESFANKMGEVWLGFWSGLLKDFVNTWVGAINSIIDWASNIINNVFGWFNFGKGQDWVNSWSRIPNWYATGASDINSGTVFVAGEMGKTEAVYSGSNGKTNVANVKQMEQAFYNALTRYGSEEGGTIIIQTYLDGEKVYEKVTTKANEKGNVWAKV